MEVEEAKSVGPDDAQGICSSTSVQSVSRPVQIVASNIISTESTESCELQKKYNIFVNNMDSSQLDNLESTVTSSQLDNPDSAVSSSVDTEMVDLSLTSHKNVSFDSHKEKSELHTVTNALDIAGKNEKVSCVSHQTERTLTCQIANVAECSSGENNIEGSETIADSPDITVDTFNDFSENCKLSNRSCEDACTYLEAQCLQQKKSEENAFTSLNVENLLADNISCDKHFLTERSEFHQKSKKFKKKYAKNKDNFFNLQKYKPIRPNYFVAIQITNPEIHKAVVEIQKSLLESSGKIAPALIDVATLHITLLVAHIENDDQLHEACSALDHCGALLSDDLSRSPVCLTFDGLSHFSHQTLYVNVVDDEHSQRLFEVAQRIRRIFFDMNVTMPDKRDFTAHLTIAKLSKVVKSKGKAGIRKIDPASYLKFLKTSFGTQVVTGIQLLSMTKAKDSNRYYFNSRQVNFDVLSGESLDHSLCCHPRQPYSHKELKRSYSTTPAVSKISSLSSDVLLKGLIGGAVVLSTAYIMFKFMQKRNNS